MYIPPFLSSARRIFNRYVRFDDMFDENLYYVTPSYDFINNKLYIYLKLTIQRK